MAVDTVPVTFDLYKNSYTVSSDGVIKSLDRTVGKTFIKGRTLKQHPYPSGYLRVTLVNNWKRKTVATHIVVARAFVSNPENKPEVDHIDGNILNNSAANLRWVTGRENIVHAVNSGRKIHNEICKADIYNAYRMLCENCRSIDISKKIGISVDAVYRIKTGRTGSSITGIMYIHKNESEAAVVYSMYHDNKMTAKEIFKKTGVSVKTIGHITRSNHYKELFNGPNTNIR